MWIKKLKTIVVSVCFSLSAVPTVAQDLLARQAPIDKKMKALDSVQLHRLIQHEQYGMPSSDLYEEWENRFAHKATELPDSFRIDLRDFQLWGTLGSPAQGVGRKGVYRRYHPLCL